MHFYDDLSPLGIFDRCAHNETQINCVQTKAMIEEKLEEKFISKVDEADIPQSFIEWALKKLKCSQEDRMARHKGTLSAHQGSNKQVMEKIDAMVDCQLVAAIRLPEELFNEKLTALNAEKERLKDLIADFDASATQWTEDIINELKFTLHLRTRFKKAKEEGEKRREERLSILHRLGQTIQLKDGELIFGFKPMYMELAKGKADAARPWSHTTDLRTRKTARCGRFRHFGESRRSVERVTGINDNSVHIALSWTRANSFSSESLKKAVLPHGKVVMLFSPQICLPRLKANTSSR